MKRDVSAREVSARTTKARVGRPPAIGLGMLLRAADSTFNRHLRDELGAHDVTFGQFQHLRNLWVENGLTQAELSRRIGIEMASSTAILDSLEARRLITRVRNAADRRKINVFLDARRRRPEEAADGLRGARQQRGAPGFEQRRACRRVRAPRPHHRKPRRVARR